MPKFELPLRADPPCADTPGIFYILGGLNPIDIGEEPPQINDAPDYLSYIDKLDMENSRLLRPVGVMTLAKLCLALHPDETALSRPGRRLETLANVAIGGRDCVPFAPTPANGSVRQVQHKGTSYGLTTLPAVGDDTGRLAERYSIDNPPLLALRTRQGNFITIDIESIGAIVLAGTDRTRTHGTYREIYLPPFDNVAEDFFNSEPGINRPTE